MGSSFSFIVDGFRHSYSSLSSFETCAFGYKLSYIEIEDRVNNFFSDYGKMIHLVNEKYFKKELNLDQLADFYGNNYNNQVLINPPPFPKGMGEKYREQGQLYFDFFLFDEQRYDVLGVEETIKFKVFGVDFVAKPDLILYDKLRKINILIDYKTSSIFKGDIPDKKKLAGYYKQLYIYAYALRHHWNTPISELQIWFPRVDKKIETELKPEYEDKAMEWVHEVITKIQNEEEFNYNNTEEYFCKYLCGVRYNCPYWKRS